MPNTMRKQLLSFLLIAVTTIGCGTNLQLSQDLLQLASETDGKQKLNIVTLGHVDHGMETVTAAIVKRQADKGLAEPVHLDDILAGKLVADFSNSFQITHTEVSYMSCGRTYSHIQCRTYLDYVKELIAGPKRFDGAVLVVSAADGPMPQTKELILLAHKVAVPQIVVFLNKCDLVDDKELLELVELEIRELLSKYGFPGDNIAIIRGNSLPAYQNPSDPAAVKCIDDLLDAINSSIPDPVPEKNKPFLMAVDEVLTVEGRGTVANGRIERGLIKIGDEIEIVGRKENPKRTKVTSFEAFKKPLDEGRAGDNMGCLLSNISIEEIEAGNLLAKPGSITLHTKPEGEVYFMSKDEGGRDRPFFSGYRPQFRFGTTAETPMATLVLDDAEMLELAIEKGTGLAAEKSVLAIEKGTALRGGNVKMG